MLEEHLILKWEQWIKAENASYFFYSNNGGTKYREIHDERKMALLIISMTICKLKLSSWMHFFQEARLGNLAEWIWHTGRKKEHGSSCSKRDGRCRTTSKDGVQAQTLLFSILPPNRISLQCSHQPRFSHRSNILISFAYICVCAFIGQQEMVRSSQRHH